MNNFKFIPLSKEYAQKIRTKMSDDFGHSLKAISLSGRALCRYCLADGKEGMQHILFSYRPVTEDKNPYSETGPVYIHDQCEQYNDLHTIPPDLITRKYLTVRGYNQEQLLVKGYMSEGKELISAIERLFENQEINYLHVSDASSGCYFVKIVRA